MRVTIWQHMDGTVCTEPDDRAKLEPRMGICDKHDRRVFAREIEQQPEPIAFHPPEAYANPAYMVLITKEGSGAETVFAATILDGAGKEIEELGEYGGALNEMGKGIARIIRELDSKWPLGRCPDCGHAAHGPACYNLASDNECSCTRNTKTN